MFNRKWMAPGPPRRCYLLSVAYLQATLSQNAANEHHVPPTMLLRNKSVLTALPPCLDLALIRAPWPDMYLFQGTTGLVTIELFSG
jgi:hypothetical protein